MLVKKVLLLAEVGRVGQTSWTGKGQHNSATGCRILLFTKMHEVDLTACCVQTLMFLFVVVAWRWVLPVSGDGP